MQGAMACGCRLTTFETWIAEQWTQIADPDAGLAEFTRAAEQFIAASKSDLDPLS